MLNRSWDFPAYIRSPSPKVEEVWMLVPTHRSQCVQNILNNFSRQRVPDGCKKKLCIVESQGAIGAFPSDSAHVILRAPDSAQTAADVRNVAMEFLHDLDAYVVHMDDDDYYGPEYLAEHMGYAQPDRLVGKQNHWVLFEGRSLCLFRPWDANKKGHFARAGTIGAFARKMKRWPPGVAVGEEEVLCRSWIKGHGEVLLTSIFHCCYHRREDHGSHAFRANPRQFLSTVGAGRVAAFPLTDFPLVDGEKHIKTDMYELVTYQKFSDLMHKF